jgi:hypothetical protein
MVDISSAGSGEGPGQGNRPAYSTKPFYRRPLGGAPPENARGACQRRPPAAAPRARPWQRPQQAAVACRSGAPHGMARPCAVWTGRAGCRRVQAQGFSGRQGLGTARTGRLRGGSITLLTLIISVVAINGVWYWIKSIIKSNGYPMNLFSYHLRDIKNMRDLVKKESYHQKRKKHQSVIAIFYVLIIIFLCSAIVIFIGLQ